MIQDSSRLLIAMDFSDKNQALAMAETLDPKTSRLKVGKQMYTLFGPDLVKQFHAKGFEIFLDLKFHDIPNTVAKACAAAADLGVWMLNVHTSGGRKMMEASVKELQKFGTDAPLLIGVTVLTSMGTEDLPETGISSSIEARVLMLAQLAQSSGLDGVVCSAHEARLIRQAIGDDFLLVTPGIRPQGSDVGDQHRVMTPEKALAAGADYLVIGRPITQASDPLKAMCDISDSITSWLSNAN